MTQKEPDLTPENYADQVGRTILIIEQLLKSDTIVPRDLQGLNNGKATLLNILARHHIRAQFGNAVAIPSDKDESLSTKRLYQSR